MSMPHPKFRAKNNVEFVVRHTQQGATRNLEVQHLKTDWCYLSRSTLPGVLQGIRTSVCKQGRGAARKCVESQVGFNTNSCFAVIFDIN